MAGLTAKEKGGGGDFKVVDAGVHVAVCDMVVDLGIQTGPYGDSHQCYIRFNIPDVRVKWTDGDGVDKEGPAVVGMFNTVSLHKKSNLRGVLESWRGAPFTPEQLKGFDLFKLLGATCQLNVTHQEKKDGDGVRAIIKAVMPLGKGQSRVESEIPPVGYSPSEAVIGGVKRPPAEALKALSPWLQKKVEDQVIPKEKPGLKAAGPSDAAEPDEDQGAEHDMPF